MPFSFWSGRERAVGGLEDAVRHALRRVPPLRDAENSELRVKAYGGEVIVAGIVSTDEVRDLVLRVAANVPGVRIVRNKLLTDAELTCAVRESLRADPITAIASIEPVVVRGVAELRGSAAYDAQLAALKIARGVEGIRDVVNRLQLSSPAA
jgi:osmotically-inducible protein OsmY